MWGRGSAVRRRAGGEFAAPPPLPEIRFFLSFFAPELEKSPRRGVYCPAALVKPRVLVNSEEHCDSPVSHCFRDAFDVSAMHERKRGEGVPQIVGPDAPRDTGPLEALCQPLEIERTGRPL